MEGRDGTGSHLVLITAVFSVVALSGWRRLKQCVRYTESPANSGKRVFVRETFHKFSLFKNNISKQARTSYSNYRALCISKIATGCIVGGYVSVHGPDA